jgi:hypothetical protein
MCNIHQNGWRITWGTQLERRVLPLESRSYNKSHPSPKLVASLWLRIESLPSFVFNPCLTFLNSTCLSFTPNQVHSLVCIQHQAILRWFYQRLPNCPVGARVSLILSKYPTWCRSTFEPCRYDLSCAFMYLSYLGIQGNVVFDRAKDRFCLEVLISMEDVVLDFGTWGCSFPFWVSDSSRWTKKTE